jgi:coronin-7
MMAWRFKSSKYKNTYPLVPPASDHIRDLSIGSYMSQGNFITASAAFMAFNWELEGSTLAVLPLETKGRARNILLIEAHSEFVTDHQFSPFDDGLLATCSSDRMVSLKIITVPSASFME